MAKDVQQEFEFERVTVRAENRSSRWREHLVGQLLELGLYVPGLPRSLVGTVEAIVAHLTGQEPRVDRPATPTKVRARLLDDVFVALRSPKDATWPERVIAAVAAVVEAEGITEMQAATELTRRVVAVALEPVDDVLADADTLEVVRWADTVGYLDGTWVAERVAHRDAHELAAHDLEAAVARLERAIHHRTLRYQFADGTLPRLRLQAAAWRAELGDHRAALEHFMRAAPAVDATSDPTAPEVIASFRAASDSARLLRRTAHAVAFQTEVVARLQRVIEVAWSRGADHSYRQELRATLVQDELTLAQLHLLTNRPDAALRILDVVESLPVSVVRPTSRSHTVALGLRAQAYQQAGRRIEAQELARRTLPQARRHFGVDDPLVATLEEMGGQEPA